MKREEADAFLHQKVEDGKLISPVLPDGVKNYLIDIDGTIIEDVPNEELNECLHVYHLKMLRIVISGMMKVT